MLLAFILANKIALCKVSGEATSPLYNISGLSPSVKVKVPILDWAITDSALFENGSPKLSLNIVYKLYGYRYSPPKSGLA